VNIDETVTFDCTDEERDAALRIAQRGADLVKATTGRKVDILSMQMDLIATHANGNPLDFAKLEAFDDFNLLHDLGGIYQHLDRSTGKLRDFFSPRSSRND
jgi:hypothetical protein